MEQKEESEKDVAVVISSNTLFNFMQKYDYLIQALEKGFWPRYSIEPYWNGKCFAIPMLCFCDIPLSHIKKHLSDYGEYGIGVTKKFADKHNITPVQYIASGTTMMEKVEYYISRYKRPVAKKTLSYEEYMLYYLKKVKGKNCEGKICKFYDEREWRYIPPISEDVHLSIFDSLEDAESRKDSLSMATEQKRIKLDPNDISYLFVPTDNEKKSLLKRITRIYGDSDDIADLMKTKILTCKQIREDF